MVNNLEVYGNCNILELVGKRILSVKPDYNRPIFFKIEGEIKAEFYLGGSAGMENLTCELEKLGEFECL